MTTKELIAEVLRLDAEASPAPWYTDGGPEGSCPVDLQLIEFYREAAPALAMQLEELAGMIRDRCTAHYAPDEVFDLAATIVPYSREHLATIKRERHVLYGGDA